jgi:type I restriction enzyme S subunit
MSSERQKVKLIDICVPGGVQTGPFGSQLHQKDYVEIGTPIITVEHLGDNRIIHQNLPRITEQDKERLKSMPLKRGI